uniref:Cytochrome P450 n=1 Tax=Schizophyllum commune (strain H4-8 / FGSC 9210) TaxID=578458 RepID=D8PU78_SCHCM
MQYTPNTVLDVLVRDSPKVVGAFFVFLAIRLAYRSLTSPTRNIPGPPQPGLPNWLVGHRALLNEEERTVTDGLDKWTSQYGHVVRLRGLAWRDRIMTTDVRALQHLLGRDDIWHRSDETRWSISRALGDSILTVEDHKHRQQLMPFFADLSEKLKDRWDHAIAANGGEAELNILNELSRMTLDVIGKAGFGYDFGALDDDAESSELARAFAKFFSVPPKSAPFIERFGRKWQDLQVVFPLLRWIPAPGSGQEQAARATMERIGRGLLAEAKANAAANEIKSGTEARDLLSVLVRANLAESQRDRLTDEEVMGQVPTFVFAGHETTATSTTWAIYQLTLDLGIQSRLREELQTLTFDGAEPTMDELNTLQYLDMFTKEVLRFYSPVPWVTRQAVRDDVVPLAKPFIDIHGNVCSEIRARKGQEFMLPIHSMHRSKEIWGEDADVFKPERWAPESSAAMLKNIPAIFLSHVFTFLGGSHACIGWRFSVVEMKAILFTLVRTFEFRLAVKEEDIQSHHVAVIRPALKGDAKAVGNLPVLVKRVA